MASTRPASQDQDSFADRRVYPRVTVALPATLQVAGKRHAVQLLDVSAGGAKLKGAVKLAAGTAILLDCGTLARSAVVRWQNDGVMGVKFDHELETRVVTALIDRSTALGVLLKTRG